MAKGNRGERFSPVDAAWLHMDRHGNRMMITGVMTFDETLDFERVLVTVERRMCCYPRYRMSVKEPLLQLGTPRWELDPYFDIRNHIHRIALPDPGDHAQLQDLVGELMSTPLDMNRPLWQMHVVENCASGSALIVQMHHCIADGVALVQVVLGMTDKTADAPWPECPEAGEHEKGWLDGLFKPLEQAYELTSKTAKTAWKLGREVIEDPSGRATEAAALGVSGTRALAKLIFTPPDEKSVFRGKCSGEKRVAWTTMMKLDEVKAVGKAFDATVNDVLLTAIAGALGRYLVKRGDEVEGRDFRAMVPVNLRSPDEPFERLGNRFGLVILSLPVGIENPFERLRELKRRMDDIKNSPEALIAYGVLGATGVASIQLEKFIVDFFTTKTSSVMTNVPGPREPLYFAGSEIKTQMFWVPTGGELSLGVSILSYAGNVMLGIMTDVALIPDPQMILSAFHAEFDEMKRRVRAAARKRARAPQPAARHKQAKREKGRAQVAPTNGRVRANGRAHVANSKGQVKATGRVHQAHANGKVELSGHAHCEALTKSGSPCRNNPLPGSTFCARHIAAARKTVKPEPVSVRETA